MALSNTQKTVLKAAIDNNPTWAAYPQNGDGYADLAKVLNAVAVPDFPVWRTEVPVSTIIDSIDLSKYTPNTPIADSDVDPVLTKLIGWNLYSQTKQINLQLLLQGRERLDTSKPNVRAGLRDAVIQVPTAAQGGYSAPGGSSGVTTLTVCTRLATEGEKVLANASIGSDTTGTVTARVLGFEGNLTGADVQSARELV